MIFYINHSFVFEYQVKIIDMKLNASPYPDWKSDALLPSKSLGDEETSEWWSSLYLDFENIFAGSIEEMSLWARAKMEKLFVLKTE